MKYLLLILALFITASQASDCPQHYLDGMQPTTQISRELCYSEFAVGYSDSKKSAIYAAEHITKDELIAAKQLTRKDAFHEESRTPAGSRVLLSDYKDSGFDRGHLAPNADMPTVLAQYESFSLANMMPQLHHNNAGVWLTIERAVRDAAMTYNDVYAVTGAIYGETPPLLKGRIPVPGALFKAVYVPQTQAVTVYVSDNGFLGTYHTVTVSELQQMTGFDVFPSLPADKK